MEPVERVWTGYMWLENEPMAGYFQYDKETLGFIKYEEFLDLLKVTLGF